MESFKPIPVWPASTRSSVFAGSFDWGAGGDKAVKCLVERVPLDGE